MGELAELGAADTPAPLKAAGRHISALVDDWPRMDAAAKRQVLDSIFTEVRPTAARS